MEKDSEFEHVKMKGHRNSVLALVIIRSVIKINLIRVVRVAVPQFVVHLRLLP